MHDKRTELRWDYVSARLHKHGVVIFGPAGSAGLWWDEFFEVLAKAKSHGFITQEQIDGTK